MTIRASALGAAKRLYRAIPNPRVRRILFRFFLWTVRGRRTVATSDGIVFDLDLGEMIDVSLFLGEYESDIVSAIRRYCRPGWRVLDIGANVGAHSLRFAKEVGPSGCVYAFEPTEFAFRKLIRNVGLNSFRWVRPLRIALSDGPEGMAPIQVRSSWRSDGTDVRESNMTEFRRLDDWSRSEGVDRVELIKLDVDGNEYGVLNGGRALLAGSLPLLFIEAAAYHFADPTRNPFRLLSELGYRFWDSKSLAEYGHVGELQRELEREDAPDSRNVIASVRELGTGAK